jgi:hypothetical protein
MEDSVVVDVPRLSDKQGFEPIELFFVFHRFLSPLGGNLKAKTMALRLRSRHQLDADRNKGPVFMGKKDNNRRVQSRRGVKPAGKGAKKMLRPSKQIQAVCVEARVAAGVAWLRPLKARIHIFAQYTEGADRLL